MNITDIPIDTSDFNLGSWKGSKIFKYKLADQSTYYEFFNPVMDKKYQCERYVAHMCSISDPYLPYYKLTDNVRLNTDMICTSRTIDNVVIVVPNAIEVMNNLTSIIRSHKSKWEKFKWILK